MSKTNDISNKRCFICGENDADSVDHIPPKCLFLKKYREQGESLITVPAHISCNKSFEKDDEYFRYFLSIPAYWTSDLARELWDKKINKQVHRKESVKYRKYLLDNIQDADIRSETGIILGRAPVAALDSKRVERVIERITRGIYYKINRNILPLDTQIESQMLEVQSALNQIARFKVENKFKSIGNTIFKYHWQQV